MAGIINTRECITVDITASRVVNPNLQEYSPVNPLRSFACFLDELNIPPSKVVSATIGSTRINSPFHGREEASSLVEGSIKMLWRDKYNTPLGATEWKGNRMDNICAIPDRYAPYEVRLIGGSCPVEA